MGKPSARIRDLLWDRTVELCRDGRALLVYSAANEQGMEFRTHRHEWDPTDFDGVTLMVRPKAQGESRGRSPRRTGWAAARYRGR